MSTVLAVDAVDVTKRFGDLVAVDGIAVQVEPGEVYGVLGPNGAGKTTFLRLLLGLIRPDAGTLEVSWTDPNVPLPDGATKFELNVHSNDCHTAGGPSKFIGTLTIADLHGKEVGNPVFELDSRGRTVAATYALGPDSTAPVELALPAGTTGPVTLKATPVIGTAPKPTSTFRLVAKG